MSGRAGIDPIDRIVAFDNHDAAYGTWREAGTTRRTLVHVDAHHDMWWAQSADRITIGNFLSLAAADGIVDRIFWVVPDSAWTSAAGRRAVLRHLRQLTRDHPGADRRIRWEDARCSVRLGRTTLTVCPFALLPRSDEPVLLDLDVDFMVIPTVSHGRFDRHGVLPWCWPGELVDRCRAAGIRTDLVTIARSVEGGYTPLKWKYLGDELRERLAEPCARGPVSRGRQLMREAAIAATRGDFLLAERAYEAAGAALPGEAAVAYHRALLAMEAGRVDEARRHHVEAVGLDPSYRTPFASGGFPCFWDGRSVEAEQHFRSALLLDPRDAHAHLGLGLVAGWRKRWTEAAALLEAALRLDSRLVDAHRALGDVLARTGRRDEAIAAYERSLQLVLAGQRPLVRPIVSEAPRGRLVDPGHCHAHAALARLYAARGWRARAISGYRISIAGGRDEPADRGHLAWLHLKQANWRAALEQLRDILRQSPARCRQRVLRTTWRLRCLAGDLRARWRPIRARWRLA